MSGHGTTPPPVYGLLLSGGASTRMQRDKAHVEYRGEPQLLRAWRLLGEVTEQAFVSVREDQRGDPLRAGLPMLVDSYDSIGPAAGILSAQDAYPGAAWLVLACDLPLMTTRLLRWLAEVPTKSTVIPVVEGRAQPLCSRWSAADLHRLVELFAGGYRAFKTMYENLDIAFVDEREWGAVASARIFTDTDAPEDLERLGIVWEVGGAKVDAAGRIAGQR